MANNNNIEEILRKFQELIEAIDISTHACENLWNEIFSLPNPSKSYTTKKNQFLKMVTHTIHLIDTAIKVSTSPEIKQVGPILKESIDYLKSVKETILELRRSLYNK